MAQSCDELIHVQTRHLEGSCKPSIKENDHIILQ